MLLRTIWLFIIFCKFCEAWINERPVLESIDGNLFISSAKDKNITLKPLGNGVVNINDINLLHVATEAQKASKLIDRWKSGRLADIEFSIQRLSEYVEGPHGLLRRMDSLTGRDSTYANTSNLNPNTNPEIEETRNEEVRKVRLRVTNLAKKVRNIERKLRRNDCVSDPCQNGGTCIDLYDGVQCLCPTNFEGPFCSIDVDECMKYKNTDLGCQNGATCHNIFGSYECICSPGWYGKDCVLKSTNCSLQNDAELCGHGHCITVAGSPLGYTCLCKQGWEAQDVTNPTCTKDVNECALNHPPCSVNPPVVCHNVPGSYFCGSCPQGYTGNGYYCSDVDECLYDNGGCSTVPRVQCINTMGSRICGSCPTGYEGNGEICTYVGGCKINNGGCHPLAICSESSFSGVTCRCHPGYIGDGIATCTPQSSPTDHTGACASSPCIHGSCIPGVGNTFSCHCQNGYMGILCNLAVDPCNPNPCRNNGVCKRTLSGGVTCECTSSFTGSRCQKSRQSCGAVLRDPAGTVEYPLGGVNYQDGQTCAWQLKTNHSFVFNVTFTRFSLESSSECAYDFLEIHDGESTRDHPFGRFCGGIGNLPNRGNIISSHNALYFWFRSDHTVASEGFAFTWNVIPPVCGNTIRADIGTINSPGYPGKYPPHRDCYWYIYVTPGKRINLHFAQMMLEEHATCEYDYLQINETTTYGNRQIGLYCNHTHPTPLISSGSELILHFHSDSAGQDFGFQITYSSQAASPECGGVFTQDHGDIASPGYLSSVGYEANTVCEWEIRLPPNERIKITWIGFELESSTSCIFDSVSLYEGGTMESPLIGSYCGYDLPESATLNTNILLIRLQTDMSSHRQGFHLKYETACGGEFYEPNGTIQSPLYPSLYPPSKMCTYKIIQPAGKVIALSLEFLEIETLGQGVCAYDLLNIYDGMNDNATRLASLCGTNDNMPAEPYISKHNYMYLVFESDINVQYRGFSANYTTLDVECGGIHTDPEGDIQYPVGGGEYRNNLNCIWLIHAPPGHIVQISWSLFSLEHDFKCRNDYVELFDSYKVTASKTMGKFCSNVLPPSMMTQGQDMTIAFRSDFNLGYRGFNAHYKFVDISKSCDGHLFAMTGVIRSPNYPENYPRSVTCEWIIEAPSKHQVILRVKDFQIEKKGCLYDYLEIRNGLYNNSPLIGKYCGDLGTIPSTIKSFSNHMFLRFVSDTTEADKGFEIEWDLLTIGCGGTLTAANGDIISPNYPQPYGKSALCTWNIIVSAGSFVQIVFADFELETHNTCRFDYLEIGEGSDANRQNVNRYCGTKYPNVVTFQSNLVTIRFRSDPSNHYRGFHLKYSTECHNTIRGIQGVIESPNFPRNYEHSTNCTWMIEAPIGNKVNITFSHFELESGRNENVCDNDYLKIEEGSEGTATNVLGTFCDTEILPPKIASKEHQVFVTFITDSFINHNGFRLEWVVNGCVEHLTKPKGTFSSPGYPTGYPLDTVCEWLIEVDYVHSIQLTFDEVLTEKGSNCDFDLVDIYSGGNDKAPKLGELCHSTKPVTFTSSGNKIYVRFISDGSTANKGFQARYESVNLRCGGHFTAQSGSIHSPYYPQNYPHNQNCEWLLIVDTDHVVRLNFTNFDIENTKNCSDDYVKVYDGPSNTAALLGTFCHNKIPPTLTSTGNQMLVVMRSDSFLTAKGFKADYQRACGATITVKDNGILSTSSSLFLRELATNCSWILIAEDPADHITLTFTHMQFPSDCDNQYVQVHDGPIIEGPSLGTWCTTDVPPPIISSGNSLTVNLVSNLYNSESSFSAFYSSLNTACGGNYSSMSGSLTSPSYPNSYPMNAECIWTISVSPGNGIVLGFPEFSLETSSHCNEDYLEVRESNGIGKLLGVFCSETPETIISNKTLWIKFRSDGKGTASGFRADYVLLHGMDLDGPTGQIASPLYPKPLVFNEEYSWRITVEFGWIIKIEFQDFAIGFIGHVYDGCSVKLDIYDGYNDEAPTLFSDCGITKPEPVYSSSDTVYIKLVSVVYSLQWHNAGSLFLLSWHQIPRGEIHEENQVQKLSECNQMISLTDPRNESYVISSPGYPDGYSTNLECNWFFTSPLGTHLTFQGRSMDLEETTDCLTDYVAIYSGNALNSNDGTLLRQECLSNNSLITIPTGNEMTVRFVSDYGVNGTGFEAVVYRECGGQLKGPTGIIQYDNSSYYAVHSLRCEWNVTVRPGRTIEVKFLELEMMNKDPKVCNRNFIMLKNGESAFSPLLGEGKYCGDSLPSSLMTTTNKLYVKAVWLASSAKFKLSYREVGMDCGGQLILSGENSSVEFSTPNYPNVPPPYTECIWTLLAPAGKRLSIHFINAFDLTDSANCEKEYVEIRDGGTESSKILGRFCSDIAPSTITSNDNALYVHFYSDVSDQKNGFHAVVTTDAICGGIMRGVRGVIRSPNYPNNYPKNQNCVWWIIGPLSYSLRIQFQDIHLPSLRKCNQTDHLIISEKLPENSTATEIGTYCGWNKPELIRTASNEALITFVTDDKEFTWYRGFSLNYSISFEKCGGALSGMFGEFKTSGYPNGNLRRYCVWRIVVPEGFQVVVDVLDIESDDRYPIKFFNDMYHISKIRFLKASDSEKRIVSSSNIMVVSHFSQFGQRGLKAKFSAVAPAPCGGLMKDQKGSLSVPTTRPFNETAFYCQWKMEPPEEILPFTNETGITMTLKVSGIIGDTRQATRNCLFYQQYVRVTDPDALIATVCGNLMSKPMYVRTPSTSNTIKVLNATEVSPMKINLTYEWQQCGGVLGGPFHTIRTPIVETFPINCAWEVKFPDNGEIINLNFNSINLGSCEKNYIIVRNGGPNSPELDKICGNIIPQKIVSSSHKLWIEFYSETTPNDFEFTLDQIGNECGSVYRGNRKEISSPKFPSSYLPNVECVWTLVAEAGYHIRLEFVDRFNLESSTNCQNDYLQLFKWNDNEKGDNEWIEIDKVCGRNTPGPYNSTSTRLKVLFHSNEAIEGDGFRALWYQDCGGVFDVTKEMKYIKSPNYPSSYKRNQFCNYTLIAPEKNIIVDFLDFQVEQGNKGKRDCRWDNVTIITEGMYYFDEPFETVFCGSELPAIQKSYSKMQIILRTDSYRQMPGFFLRYFLSECGGEITEPQMISSLNNGPTYFGGINCTWIIKAPTTKRVVLRFEEFSLEYSSSCSFDAVDVYEGALIDIRTRLGCYCGNLTGMLPVVKTSSNIMTVNFISDESHHFGGFKALVTFANNEAEGCGGILNITDSISFRTQKSEFYDSIQDCHWTAITSPTKQLRFTINSIDLKPNANRTIRFDRLCSGDYLEIRDGKSQYGDLLAQVCGSSSPSSVTSSTNSLWIRLFTDGSLVGRGVTATIEAIESYCGATELLFSDKTQTLRSPSYPDPYPSDITCRWLLTGSSSRGVYYIHFTNFDLMDEQECYEEYVQITDYNDQHIISEGYGENHVVSGKIEEPFSLSMHHLLPTETLKYCGSIMPHDFYSYGDKIEVKFKSSVQKLQKHKGFEFEYGTSMCDRNRTGVQGRLVHQGFVECWLTITAPINHTISLYFNNFRLGGYDSCEESSLQIFDGGFKDHRLINACGYEIPDPVFSTGNKLSFHSFQTNSRKYNGYDITYVATDKGRGCGGKIFNYAGKFTSPMYPGPFRNESECTWHISVPVGFKVALVFTDFDIGSDELCGTNNVQVYSLNNAAVYCGSHLPANFYGSNNEVEVTYRTSINNGGKGWVIEFTSVRGNQIIPSD
ncbi:cubilin-like isoform X2 [Leptopilina heterotoma]|uniref:cubilin-like isoform X2 n=1 Tax=Leptopilina heterotoma TaxID=63436 RepID=UPI001CA8031C|nr:cubilin-like isoform X2 [Leptopilina heterotoma]